MAEAYGSTRFATDCRDCGKAVSVRLESTEQSLNTAAIHVRCAACETVNWAESNTGESG